jgi:hypothetical protein
MKNILWMNSGGKDCAYVYKNLEESYDKLTSYLLITDDELSMTHARAFVKKENLKSIEIPYADTRTAIRANIKGATTMWVMELHLRAFFYAFENGYDTILTGSTNVFASKGSDSNEYEEFFEELQTFLEVPEDKKVTLVRPIKKDVHYDFLSLTNYGS